MLDWTKTTFIGGVMGSRGVFTFLRQQLDVIKYAFAPLRPTRALSDREYSSNSKLWADLEDKTGGLATNSVVHLHDFAITEWLPRSPGLYHNPRADGLRKQAEHYRMSERDFLMRAERRGIFRSQEGAREVNDEGGRDRASVIYDPYGKARMIEGGIGCLRLKDLQLPQGRSWFLGATSSEAVHEGVPIMLGDELYGKYIDDISRGGFSCNLTAHVRLIPDILDGVYRSTPHIRKVYLEVADDFRRVRREAANEKNQRKGDWVTGAVGFRTKEHSRDKLLTTYTSFVNGSWRSLQEATVWLEEVYVGAVFDGEVLTDFDQQATRFTNAVFSLDNLRGNTVDIPRARTVVIRIAGSEVGERLFKHLSRSNVKVEARMRDVITIGKGADVRGANIAQGGSSIVINSQIESLSERLKDAISENASKMPARQEKKLREDGTKLRRKLKAKKPSKSGITDTLSSIAKTARAVGNAGKPITKLVGMLMTALG